MKKVFKKFEKLEEIEQNEKAKMYKYLYDVELDLSYEAVKVLTEKIAQKEGNTIEETRYKAEGFVEEVVKEKEEKSEEFKNEQ